MAKDDKYFLTDADRELLKQVIDREKVRQLNTRNRPMVPEEQGTAPEVYAAWVPTGGIPALTETGVGTPSGETPGQAICQIYQILHGPTHPVFQKIPALVVTVYNLSLSAIAEHQYITVNRDKFGSWLAQVGGEGTVNTVLSQNPGTGDSTITIANPTKIEIDLVSGLYLVNNAGAAEIGAQNATYTHKGVVTLDTQTLGRGVKRFSDTSSEFNSLQIIPFTNPQPAYANQSNPGVAFLPTIGSSVTYVWMVPGTMHGAPGATLGDLPQSLLQWGGGGILPLGVYAAIDDSAYVRLGVTGLSKSGGQLKIVRGIVVGEIPPTSMVPSCGAYPGVLFPTTMFLNVGGSILCPTQYTLTYQGNGVWICPPPFGQCTEPADGVTLSCNLLGFSINMAGAGTISVVSTVPFVANVTFAPSSAPCFCGSGGVITGGGGVTTG